MQEGRERKIMNKLRKKTNKKSQKWNIIDRIDGIGAGYIVTFGKSK